MDNPTLLPIKYAFRDSINKNDICLYNKEHAIKEEEFTFISDICSFPPPKRMIKAIHDHNGMYLMENHDIGKYSYCYFIAWDNISSYFDVLHLFKRLLDKDWFDIEMVEDILVCIEKHRNINFHFDSIVNKTIERNKITKSLRYKILNRDKFKCRVCGRTSKSDGVSLEVDHIIPLSKGGSSDEINLQVLCVECNRGKHVK